MDPTELCYLSAGELSRLIQQGDVSPVEVVEAHLARVEALEPTLNSFITLLPDQAMAAARRAEGEIRGGRYRGPLHGIPLGLKDLYHVGGVRNTSGSRIFDSFVPSADCTIASRFGQAGAMLLGKMNMHQLAYGPTGENPRLRPHAQSLGPGAHSRGLQRRLGLGGGLGPVHPDHGQRHRRLHPHTQRPLWVGRPEAHLRPPEPSRAHGPVLVPGPSRTHCPHRGGLRPGAQRRGGIRPHGPGLGPGGGS